MIFPPVESAAWVVNTRVTGKLALAATRWPAAMVNVTAVTEVAAAKAHISAKRHKTAIRRTIAISILTEQERFSCKICFKHCNQFWQS